MRLALLALVATVAAAEPGFEPIFDGETLEGWSVLPRKNAEGAWVVEDGALKPEGRPGSLASRDSYGDFELRLEWKIANMGNSGVLYRFDGDGDPAASSIEFQLADNRREASQKYSDRRCGAAYGLYTPTVDATRPPGEWNTMRIVARGSQIEHWVNGQRVVAFDLESEDFALRVQAGKFAERPGFAKARRGRIVLQDHSSSVWFRSIRIKRLN